MGLSTAEAEYIALAMKYWPRVIMAITTSYRPQERTLNSMVIFEDNQSAISMSRICSFMVEQNIPTSSIILSENRSAKEKLN